MNATGLEDDRRACVTGSGHDKMRVQHDGRHEQVMAGRNLDDGIRSGAGIDALLKCVSVLGAASDQHLAGGDSRRDGESNIGALRDGKNLRHEILLVGGRSCRARAKSSMSFPTSATESWLVGSK